MVLTSVLSWCPSAAAALAVTVSVDATESFGNPLHYAWKVTEGTIVNVDAASTIWTLPSGPGLHFAYVLVSNGKGGYTQRRVAVNTDVIGTPPATSPPTSFDAPPGPAPTGVPFRTVLRGNGYYQSPAQPGAEDNGIYLPGARAFLINKTTGARSPVITADARGSVVFPDVIPGKYRTRCTLTPGVPDPSCGRVVTIGSEAVNDTYGGPQNGRGGFVGRVVLADGTPCGVDNAFFDRHARGRVTLLDGVGNTLAGPFSLNVWGHYGFDSDVAAATIRVECEGNTPLILPIAAFDTGATPRTVFSASAAPIVNGMSAKLGGAEVGLFLPPPSALPSDNVVDDDVFLSMKGLDSRLGACRYYVAIGAAKSCGAQGQLRGAITFDDWRRKVRMEPYTAKGRTDVVATYINRVDLNLTRNHHSISYGLHQVAAYVCNHLGPTDESQNAADVAIDNAVHHRNLVACVAMDHGVTLGVNGDQPFTRFLIFGPSGALLPSVNLDGRGEKFVPGTCVACHGGSRYAGRYPDNGSGYADIGAHFLPYDSGNFTFSKARGLTLTDQQAAIHQLNRNVLRSDPPQGVTDLIRGWYRAGTDVLDADYLPPSWQTQSADAQTFYRSVYAPSCRTCHVAFSETLNFDHYQRLITTPRTPPQEDGALRTQISVCSGSASFSRNYSMPNSLRTFNLFWGSSSSSTDQPALLAAFIGGLAGDPTAPCSLSPMPAP